MPTPNEERDERILVALKVARHHHLSIWDAALREHKGHPTFRMHGHAYTLEYGFTCECSGTEREWRVTITSLKEMLPAARETVIRLFKHHALGHTRKARRERARAELRAKALLHRFLTREQRLEFRKTRGFTMKGKDGREYLVTHGSSTNVILEHEGEKYALCVIPEKDWGQIPVSDVLLAQKIMLETDPEAFIRLARVVKLKPVEGGVRPQITESYESGVFLLGKAPKKVVKPIELLDIPEQVLENPREWVETRCRD